jgi:hypothetical protein
VITGPSQSIMARLTGTGHGAAACTTTSSEDVSYRARVSSVSRSSRLNMVGTIWQCVTRCFATRRSHSSASKCSMTTTDAPSRSAAATLAYGAEWYSGAGFRYVMPARKPKSQETKLSTGSASPGGSSGSGRRMPLGCPVVPEE